MQFNSVNNWGKALGVLLMVTIISGSFWARAWFALCSRCIGYSLLGSEWWTVSTVFLLSGFCCLALAFSNNHGFPIMLAALQKLVVHCVAKQDVYCTQSPEFLYATHFSYGSALKN